MLHVLIALVPAVGVALYYFGLPALEVLVISVVSCMATEALINRLMLHRAPSLTNWSALLTGVLLALNLPASLPWWTVIFGSVFAIAIGKMAFGGLGANIFNPALVGRVFLLISFPVLMTSWPEAVGGFPTVDGVTGATVLGQLKHGAVDVADLSYRSLLVGDMGGSMGEVGAGALLLGGLYLVAVRVIRWIIPVGILLTVGVFDLCIGFPPMIDWLTGGMLLGAIFMATDYVTSPMTARGQLIYAVLIGVVTVVIRRWGAYPEGMSFAILIANGLTPLLDLYLHPRRFSPAKS